MQVEGHHAVCLHTVMATGARVSNAYPTFPLPRASPPKGGLIPHEALRWHQTSAKGILRQGMGMRPISLAAGQRPTAATIGRGPEREAPHTGTETRPRPHTGTETRPRLLREAAVRNIGQWAEA